MTPEPRDVIAAALVDSTTTPVRIAADVLAALRAAGYETYRPEEHPKAWLCREHDYIGWYRLHGRQHDQTGFRDGVKVGLVPASDDTEGSHDRLDS